MSDHGAKIGWIGGGIGSLVWLLILAAVFLVQGKITESLANLGFFLAGLAYLVKLAPWKLRRTPMWKIYLGFVALLLAAAYVCWYLWQAAGHRPTGPFPWLALSTLFIPVFIIGNKTWEDMHQEPRPPEQENDCI